MDGIPASHSHPFFGWLGTSPRMAGLAELIALLGADRTYFVGGTIRDHLLGCPVDAVRDVDLLYDGHLHTLQHVLSQRYALTCTPFGNPSIVLDGGVPVDIFPPATPYGEPVSLERALHHCETSANAIALGAGDGRLLDPTGGLRDLCARGTRLLPLGWSADTATRARLLTKVVNLHRRRGLRPWDLRIADGVADELRARSEDSVREAVAVYTRWRSATHRSAHC